MEIAWIKVFVLTLTQCIAPAGKMVCQEEVVEYQFASAEDCDRARVQMIDLAERADNVLIDRASAQCETRAIESSVYASSNDTGVSVATSAGMAADGGEGPRPDFLQAAHAERLQGLKSCEETDGVAPCKIGSIIIEPAAESSSDQIWRQQN